MARRPARRDRAGFDLCGGARLEVDHVSALDAVGPDPSVLLAETSAVGLVDAAGATATGITGLLMAWDVDGDAFVLLRRDLRSALWVAWDREREGVDVRIARCGV